MLLWLIKKTCFTTAVATLNLNWAQSFVALRERLAWNKWGSIGSSFVEVSFMLLVTVTSTPLLFLEQLQGFPLCFLPALPLNFWNAGSLVVEVWTTLFFFFFLKKISIWFDLPPKYVFLCKFSSITNNSTVDILGNVETIWPKMHVRKCVWEICRKMKSPLSDWKSTLKPFEKNQTGCICFLCKCLPGHIFICCSGSEIHQDIETLKDWLLKLGRYVIELAGI